MIIVGLTGGIASGKSTIVKFLKNKKFKVHDADHEVKKIYKNPSTSFIKYLKKINLSTSIKGKTIDKKKIREIIFNNKSIKKKLEKYIHNEVRKKRDVFLKKNKKIKTKIVFLDIPLLFEAKLEKICDYVILLYLPKKKRIKRSLLRKGMTKNILMKIMKNQISDRDKKKKADFVINTSKNKSTSFKMILKAIDTIYIRA